MVSLEERLGLSYGDETNDGRRGDGDEASSRGSALNGRGSMYPSETNALLEVSSPSDHNHASAHSGDSSSSSTTTTSVVARSKLVGRLLLFGVSFLYGTMNVVFRFVYELPDPPSASALSTVRGWMAALCFLPFLAIQRAQREQHSSPLVSPISPSNVPLLQRPFFRVALELAVWNFGSQGLVNVGLLWTASARASFLTQTSVVMTPLVSALAGHSVRNNVWVACGCAMGGLVLLSVSHGGQVGAGFGFGDILCLMGALCWSMYIFRLSAVGEKFDEVQMQAVKTVNLAILYSTWFLFAAWRSDVSLWPGWDNAVAWLLLFYSALGPGTVADLMQQKGQAIIPASESNVILSMEPVFTALLGWIVLGEATSLTEKLGGSLIILAAIVATR
jgi:drug/metabolite transporter (DMT)-like permease